MASVKKFLLAHPELFEKTGTMKVGEKEMRNFKLPHVTLLTIGIPGILFMSSAFAKPFLIDSQLLSKYEEENYQPIFATAPASSLPQFNQTFSDSKKSISIQALAPASKKPLNSVSSHYCSGQAPFSVILQGRSQTFDSDARMFTWNFGDGDTAKGVKVAHTYKNVGTYSVTLKIKQHEGVTHQTQYTIKVTAPGNNNISALPADNSSPLVRTKPIEKPFRSTNSG